MFVCMHESKKRNSLSRNQSPEAPKSIRLGSQAPKTLRQAGIGQSPGLSESRVPKDLGCRNQRHFLDMIKKKQHTT